MFEIEPTRLKKQGNWELFDKFGVRLVVLKIVFLFSSSLINYKE